VENDDVLEKMQKERYHENKEVPIHLVVTDYGAEPVPCHSDGEGNA